MVDMPTPNIYIYFRAQMEGSTFHANKEPYSGSNSSSSAQQVQGGAAMVLRANGVTEVRQQCIPQWRADVHTTVQEFDFFFCGVSK